MEKTINQRLTELINLKSRGQAEFERLCGMKRGALNGSLRIDSKPSFDTLQSILKTFPDISPDWLIHGIGDLERKNIIEDVKKVSYLEQLIKGLEDKIEKLLKHNDILMDQLAKDKGSDSGLVYKCKIITLDIDPIIVLAA